MHCDCRPWLSLPYLLDMINFFLCPWATVMTNLIHGLLVSNSRRQHLSRLHTRYSRLSINNDTVCLGSKIFFLYFHVYVSIGVSLKGMVESSLLSKDEPLTPMLITALSNIWL